ncbi:MAG TPA: hypothetical protein VHK69_01155 [Chitinophagaceae bacterium]|jgi:hypothetical protein|nr:hypothetical protein [Chitinophagaceae bacterium]
MKRTLFYLPLGLLMLAVASCTKEPVPAAPGASLPPEPADAAQTGAASLLPAKRLQKVMVAGSTVPYLAFTYDTKGRLASSVNYLFGGYYLFTYQDAAGTVLVRRKNSLQGQTLDSLIGKLNASGRLTELGGIRTAVTSAGKVVSTVKFTFTYNAAGQLIKADGYEKTNGVVTYPKLVYSWQDGNLTQVTSTLGNITSYIKYKYDVTRADKQGLWENNLIGWTDNLVGVRSKHLRVQTTVGSNDPKNHPFITTQRWSLNAGGYPATGLMIFNISDIKLNLTYQFQ